MELTATDFDAPIWAIHSRNAEMVISRPMMMNAMMALTSRNSTSTSSAPATINLSATGSRNAPNEDVSFQRRARNPSNQSVTAATIKMADDASPISSGDSQPLGR